MDDKDMALFQEFLEFKKFKEAQEPLEKPKKAKKKSKYTLRSDGYYSTQISVGFDEVTGKRIRKTLYAKTAAELDDKVAQVKVDLLNGKKIHSQKIIFKQYANKWLNQRKPFLEYKTYSMYERVLRLYCKNIDHIELKNISKSDIQDIINENMDKPRTCQQIRLTIRQVFDYALDDDLVYKNPVHNLEMPKYAKPVKRPLTKEEDILSDVTEFGDREKAYILLLKWNGLRKEEALALTKNDFNFKSNTISINKAVIFISNKPVIKEVKTDAGERILPILEPVRAFFRYYTSNLPSDWLFTSVHSEELLTEQSFRCMWKTIIRKMNRKAVELNYQPIEGLTSHIFRHNFASMLYHIGVSPKESQYLLGHSSINVTMDIYTHIDIKKLQVTELLRPLCSINAVEKLPNVPKTP